MAGKRYIDDDTPPKKVKKEKKSKKAVPPPVPSAPPPVPPIDFDSIDDIADPISIVELGALKKKRSKGLAMRLFLGFIKLTLLFALIGTTGYLAWDAIPSGDRDPTGEPVTVYIKRGSTAGDVAKVLRKAGIIRSSTVFKISAEYYGVSESLQSGEFHLRKGMKLDQVVEILGKGPSVPATRLTFPEGLTVRDMSARIDQFALEGQVSMDAASFTAAAQSAQPFASKYNFLPRRPGATLEGYLFPDTYEVLQNVSPYKLVDLMLARFAEVSSGLNWKKRPLGLTPEQIVVVASLVEKEAKVDSERPKIAAVIYNRIKAGMRLQIDATVQYALPERQGRLMYSDLDVVSPYNTYKIKGLPPGPIASPGKASLAAALAPAKGDYLYYVLKDDQGHHAFTRTYEQFLVQKRKRLGR